MRLLDRYLFRELLTPLAYCLGGIVLLGDCFALFGDLEKLQERKLHFLDVVEYSVAITPEFLVLVLPITLLLALLYTLTNHSRSNEMTAMRAAGISLGGFARRISSSANFERGVVPHQRMGCPTQFGLEKSYLGPLCPKARRHRIQKRSGQFRLHQRPRPPPVVHEPIPAGDRRNDQAAGQVEIAEGSLLLLRADRAEHTNGVWTFYNVAEYSQADDTAPLVPALLTNVLAMPDFDETPRQIRSEIKISSYQGLNAKPEFGHSAHGHFRLSAPASEPAAGGVRLAVYKILRPARRAMDVPGRGADRDSLRRVNRPAKPVFRRGRQHFHLLRFFCHPTSQPSAWLRRLSARVVGGMASQRRSSARWVWR